MQQIPKRLARSLWHCRDRFRPHRELLRFSDPGSHCGLDGQRRFPDLAHHVPHVILDTFQKRLQRSCAALDTLEIRFPLAGHSGALDLGVHDFDEPDALVRRFEAVATTNDVAPLEQHFDDGRARSRRAEAGLFHGF